MCQRGNVGTGVADVVEGRETLLQGSEFVAAVRSTAEDCSPGLTAPSEARTPEKIPRWRATRLASEMSAPVAR